MSFTDTVRFELIRRLGTGAMGTVYLARDRQLGNTVALKVLNVLDAMDLYRFKSEFRSLADIKHPNLAKLYELICEGPHWFFTMEYVGGVPFDLYVGGEPEARTDPDRLRAAMQQLCVGVHAMHAANCIHRDLKPSNVLCTPEGRVVILDFGLAKQTGSQSLKGEGLSGTPAYMAPEQAKDKPCLPAADWYAVGVMLYQVLTGRLPFEGALIELLLKKQMDTPPSPTTINPHADPALSELAMRLLERDPAARPSGSEILASLGLKEEPRQVLLDEPAPPAASLFVGRDDELQALHASYGRTRNGTLAVTLVEGPSGIGKTSLVDRFLEDVASQADSPLVLRGRCHERETLPFKAFDGIVDALSHRLAGLPIPDQARVLPVKTLYLAEVFPVLRRLEILDHSRFAVPTLTDPTELRNQAFTAFAELLARVSALSPVVAFIDDLQWADRDSFALLRALVHESRSPRLLVLATCRPWGESKGDVVASAMREFAEQPGVQTVHLTPLSPEMVAALLEGLVDFGDDVQTSHRRRLVATAATEAAGNPFFTLELARHLRRAVKGGARLTDDVVGPDLRLEHMILDRLRELPEESQRMLEVAAVAGDPLPHTALASAANVELGSEAWERGISSLVEGRLIRRVGRQGSDVVEVYHDRIVDAVMSSLDEAALRRLHEQIARAIEQWDRERTDMLARHWLVAADHERAKHYAREAAAEARTKLAFDRAAQLYETAVGLEASPDGKRELLRALGDCRAASGLASQAAEAYERAAALSDPAQATRLRHLAAEQLLRGGQITHGLEVIDEVLSQAGLRLAPTPRRAIFATAWRLLWLRLHGLQFEERPPSSISAEDRRLLDVLWSVNIGLSVVDTLRADEFLLRFTKLAMKVGDSRRVAQGLSIVAGQLAAMGKSWFGWARRIADEADVLARRTDDHATIGLARLGKAAVRYFSGEFSASADELTTVEQYFLTHCHGVAWELATVRSFTCWSLRLAGRLRELSERFDRYTADADRTGDRYMAANLRTYQSIVWLVRDAPEQARKEIDGILDSWPDDLYQVQHFFHLYARCEQALYMGRPEEAEAAIAAETARLKESAMLNISGIRIEHLWLTGRVALAIAETRPPDDRGRLLRLVRNNARQLEASDHQTSTAMGVTMAAAAAWLGPESERKRAIPTLERGVATAEAAGAMLIAESGRRWLGRILGTAAGSELLVRSERWMIDQAVRNPERLAALVVPGFRPQS